VDSIVSMEFRKGRTFFEVRWTGYKDDDTTFEPMENLVGCAQQIRDFEQRKKKEEDAVRAEILAKRQKVKETKKAEEAKLRQAAYAAAASAENEDAEQGITVLEDGNTPGGTLAQHKGKHNAVWQAFDLSKVYPSCNLTDPLKGEVCGCTPSSAGGTQNYWSHLYNHHREDWLRLKKVSGKLSAVGEAELGLGRGAATLAPQQEHL
jgi:hypothetical protein